MGFIMELDNLLVLDMPSQNFYGVEDAGLRTHYLRRFHVARGILRTIVETVQRAPKGVAILYHMRVSSVVEPRRSRSAAIDGARARVP